MTSQHDAAADWLIPAQGRMLEILAERDALLVTTSRDLAARLGLSQRDLRTCSLALESAGWITIQKQRGGRLTIGLNLGLSGSES